MFTKFSKWIACDAERSAPIVLKTITVKKLRRAVMDISGLGYYECWINGHRVSEEFFKPAVSDYSERDFSDFRYPLADKTSHTIYYNTYDVTEYLREGENTLAVMLGNGFYRQTRRVAEGDTHFGDKLILRFDLHLTEEEALRTISSDGTETMVDSFILENNLFFGEIHDYRNFDFSLLEGGECAAPKPVCIVPSPKAKILKQRCKNDVVREAIVPRVVCQTEQSVIYDVGKNIAGFVTLRALDSTVRIRHSEEMKDGSLDFESAGGEDQISECIYKNAQGRTVHPWFSWSGFRYFEVFGKADQVEVAFVSTKTKITAEFQCGNETLNWLFDTYLHTQICNMHGGVPSDCPHRERLGYTGDGQLTAEGAMLFLDSRSFYEKWMRDLADCQDVATGHIQHTAPFFGGGGGPGGWGCAIVYVPYAFYKTYGDLKILKRYYPNMLRYLECMKGFCEKGLIVREREKGWCLGDWCTLEKVAIPKPFVNTFYYVRCMERVFEIASLIGENIDFSQEIDQSKKAIMEEYFDCSTGDFCAGVQGANVFALMLGLGDERTKARMLAHYRKTMAFDTGIFGTDVLTEYLGKIGEVQLLYDLLSSSKQGSFGYMRENGATTLWEFWTGRYSHNHPMFGACTKQLFYGLLGIRANAGWKEILVSPSYIEGIEFIHAKLKFPHGSLLIDVKYRNGTVSSDIKASGSITIIEK